MFMDMDDTVCLHAERLCMASVLGNGMPQKLSLTSERPGRSLFSAMTRGCSHSLPLTAENYRCKLSIETQPKLIRQQSTLNPPDTRHDLENLNHLFVIINMIFALWDAEGVCTTPL